MQHTSIVSIHNHARLATGVFEYYKPFDYLYLHKIVERETANNAITSNAE